MTGISPTLQLMIAFLAGVVLTWLALFFWARSKVARSRLEAASRLSAAETLAQSETARREKLDAEVSELRESRQALDRDLVVYKERVEQANQLIKEQKEFIEHSRKELEDSFRSLASSALQGNSKQFLELVQQKWETTREQAAKDLDHRKKAIETLLAPLKETLTRLESETGEIEKAREGAYKGLEEQLKWLRDTTRALQEKTTSLSTALRGSRIQGQWGELALRNVVELAGLTEHCDFEEQVTTSEGKRPDMTVSLPGARLIAVDSKAPVNAYMESIEATDEETRVQALDRHVSALRGHIRALAARDYARELDGEVDLVVMFLPGDPFLSAAFQREPELQVEALRSRVLLATPTTLVALLRTVAIYWQQRSLAENAQKIAGAARELYDRAAVFGEHLSKMGRALGSAVESYNQAVGSFDKRLMPVSRQLEEMKVSEQSARRLEAPPSIDGTPRNIGNS